MLFYCWIIALRKIKIFQMDVWDLGVSVVWIAFPALKLQPVVWIVFSDDWTSSCRGKFAATTLTHAWANIYIALWATCRSNDIYTREIKFQQVLRLHFGGNGLQCRSEVWTSRSPCFRSAVCNFDSCVVSTRLWMLSRQRWLYGGLLWSKQLDEYSGRSTC